MKITIKPLTCLRCGHQWFPRQVDVQLCPRCKNARWDTPPTPKTKTKTTPTIMMAKTKTTQTKAKTRKAGTR